MISFSDIYERAINLIDDPDISRAYVNNPIAFCKVMYNFLANGVSIITAPPTVCDALAIQTAPEGEMEIFDGDGNKEYSLAINIPDGALVVCMVNGKIDQDAQISDDKTKVIFTDELQDGDKGTVEVYTTGSFDADLSSLARRTNIPLGALNQRIIDMLARATVISWADKEKNFLLDIRNLLNDTDFTLHSPANSLKSKIEWVADLRNEIFNLQNKLNWDLRNRTRSHYDY